LLIENIFYLNIPHPYIPCRVLGFVIYSGPINSLKVIWGAGYCQRF